MSRSATPRRRRPTSSRPARGRIRRQNPWRASLRCDPRSPRGAAFAPARAAQVGAPWACRMLDDYAPAVAAFLRARGSRDPDDLRATCSSPCSTSWHGSPALSPVRRTSSRSPPPTRARRAPGRSSAPPEPTFQRRSPRAPPIADDRPACPTRPSDRAAPRARNRCPARHHRRRGRARRHHRSSGQPQSSLPNLTSGSTPSAVVEGYLTAIAEGEADSTALAYLDEAPREATLLTDEVLEASRTLAPIEDIEVVDATSDEFSGEVTVSYTIGGRARHHQLHRLQLRR